MNLCSLDDLTDDQVTAILDRAEEYEQDLTAHRHVLDGRIVAMAFFEPSTRTRLSFESAAHRLGATVIGFSDAKATSSSKGETLADSARIMAGYADALVLRHPHRGAALEAAAGAGVPVINAGDGDGEHPTQTLLDLFTIRKELGRLDGIKVAIVGDLLHGRTVHSLVPALQRFGATAVQVPAPGLELPTSHGDIPITSLDEAAATADVLYVTRIQQERFSDQAAYQAATGQLLVDAALLAKSKAIVLHPLPRVGEISTDVDALSAAKYFDQARNGVPIRMAILAMLLEDRA